MSCRVDVVVVRLRGPYTRAAGLVLASAIGLAAALPCSAIAACTGLSAPAVPSGLEPQNAQQVLEKVRAGLNYTALLAQKSGIVMRGPTTFADLESQGTLMFTPAGSVLTEITGPVGATVGYDGKTAWERNESGIVRIYPLIENDARATVCEFLSGAWLSGQTRLEFALEADRSTDATLVLSYTRPGTPLHGTVEIDRATAEPRRFDMEGGTNHDTVELSEYADYNGAKLCRKLVYQTEGHVHSIMRFTEVSAAPTFIRSPYEPVLGRPDNFRFDAAVSPAIEIKKAKTGHHLVKALVNGQDIGWFIFDSGAGTEVLSTKAAEKLGLKLFGKLPVKGVGGSVDSGFYRPDSLVVGPMTIDKPLFVGLDLSMLSGLMGDEIAGVVGYGILGRSTVVVDDAAGSIELHDPDKFHLEGAAWTEVLLYGRHAVIKGAVEGHEGYLRLDTGAAQTTITMHAPAVAKYKMLEDRELSNVMLGGVGGMIEARSGKIKSIEFGGRKTENVEATFALPDKGAMNDPGTLGNVGGALLKPFILVFDYPNRRMAFIPRPEAPVEKPAATKADN